MKLLFAYPNEANYSETFIYRQKDYLKPTLTLTGGWRPFKDEHGKSIFKLPNVFRGAIKRFFPDYYAQIYTKQLAKYLLKHRPTVVLAHYGIMGTTLLEACQQTNTPLVVHFHGFDASHQETIFSYEKAYKKVFDYAQKIVVVSKDMQNALLALGCPLKKIALNSYGIDTDQYEQKTYHFEQKVVAVGRFTAKKAPQISIKAFAECLKIHPKASLTIIGGGELLGECKNLVKDLKIEYAVRFLGVKTPEEIREELQKVDIFIQHSMTAPNGDAEGTPNTILEASAIGLPIVSTYHAGIKEAVESQKTGILVAEGDQQGMAEALHKLLSNPTLCEEYGRNARQKMLKEYKIEDRIAFLEGVLLKNT